MFVSIACRRCHRVLLDDPEDWHRPSSAATETRPGRNVVATSLRDARRALAKAEDQHYPGRFTHEGARGGLSRPAVVIEIEHDGDGEARLRFLAHHGCDRRPFTYKWSTLARLAGEARTKGRPKLLV